MLVEISAYNENGCLLICCGRLFRRFRGVSCLHHQGILLIKAASTSETSKKSSTRNNPEDSHFINAPFCYNEQFSDDTDLTRLRDSDMNRSWKSGCHPEDRIHCDRRSFFQRRYFLAVSVWRDVLKWNTCCLKSQWQIHGSLNYTQIPQRNIRHVLNRIRCARTCAGLAKNAGSASH